MTDNDDTPARDVTTLPFDGSMLRAANREATRLTLAPRYEELSAKRRALFLKSRREVLSKEQARELKYLEWQIQRIQDTHVGEHLDRLESDA